MRTTGLVAALLAAACACSDESSVTDQPPTVSEAAAAPAPKPEEPATLRGMVRWSGQKIDPLPRIPMSGESSLAEAWADGGPLDPRFEVAADGALPHVFVWASKGPHESRKWDTPETRVELRASRGMYEPHVLGLMRRQPLVLLCADGHHHYCFHARPRFNREFSISVAPDGGAHGESGGKRLTGRDVNVVRFDEIESALPINDDVHTWMSAYVFVLDHPFFAVTDAQGRFEIRGLPPGEYVFKVWHEPMTADYRRGHETETTVTLASGAAADISVELR